MPNALNATYYGQRASQGGLLISEATQVSLLGKGYLDTPGIHTQEQIEGWKLVTDAVHAKGGFIFLQLWHVGRISHSSLHPEAGLPVAPSAIPPDQALTILRTDRQQVPYETPRALALEEIPAIVEEYRRGAENARAAGFDGVEIHGANGYLLDQFLQDRTNRRTDNYGGSIENRARLLLEVVDAAIGVWGKDRVGVRLSPYGTFLDVGDSDPMALFGYVLKQLSDRGIAYAHLVEPRVGNSGADAPIDPNAPRSSHIFRQAFKGTFISTGGYKAETAEHAIASDFADAIGFGRQFLANPDLPRRFREGRELNAYDRATFYGGDERGYTDYPALEEEPAAPVEALSQASPGTN